MEHNEELEQAERNLQIALREERVRELERRKQMSMNFSYSDLFIRIAAGVLLVIGVISPLYAIYLFILRFLDVDVSNYTLLLILLFGVVFVGNAFGLHRVLELSEKQKNNEDQKCRDNNKAN